MKIAFYRGMKAGRIWDSIYCLLTCSKYSRCEIVFSDEVIGKVDYKRGIGFAFQDFPSPNWDVYELECGTYEEMSARAFFNLWEGSKFDKVGFALALMHVGQPRKGQFFPAKLCASVLGSNAYRSPGALFVDLRNQMKITLIQERE